MSSNRCSIVTLPSNKRLCGDASDRSTTIRISAHFELALHDLLLRSGCKALAVEPDLEDAPRSPDFLARAPEGQRFYLEATLATGRSQSEEGADRRLREALHANR